MARPRSSVDRLHALLVEEVRQTVDHVLDDAEAVVHDRRAHLHAGGAEGDELGRVAPGRDAADAGDGHGDARVAGERGDHVQRDRLDGRAAVAAVGRAAADDGVGDHPVEVDADDALDGVDEARGRAAPASTAATPGTVMSPMLGVSLTRTGRCANSTAQPATTLSTSGSCPTAEPMPRSHMPCGQPKLSSRPSAPVSSTRRMISRQSSFDSTISETISAWSG